jgi:hypothetical protein
MRLGTVCKTVEVTDGYTALDYAKYCGNGVKREAVKAVFAAF